MSQSSDIKLEQLITHARRSRRLLPTWWIDPLTGNCACRRGVDCRKPGKHPRISEWQHRATALESDIVAWHATWPLANWGWVQDRTFAIDVDPGRGGQRSLDEWVIETGGPVMTLTQATPSGGIHMIYHQPDEPLPQVDDFMPGIEVRGVGSYIMIDPSCDARGCWSLRPDTQPLGVQDCDEMTLNLIRGRMRGRVTRDGAGKRVEDRTRRSDLPPTPEFKKKGFGWHSGSRNIDAYRLTWRLLAEVDNGRTTLTELQADMMICWLATAQGEDSFPWEEVVDCMRSAHERRERQKSESERDPERVARRRELAERWTEHTRRWGAV